MICPFCNKENSDDSRFCEMCGKKIPRCPTCGRVINKKMRFCMNDGTRLPEEVLSLLQEESKPIDEPEMKVEEERLTDEPEIKIEEELLISEPEIEVEEEQLTDEPEIKVEEELLISEPEIKIEEELLISEPEIPAEESEPRRVQYCIRCGTPCFDNQTVCADCQKKAAVASASNNSPVTTETKKKKKVIPYLMGAVLLLCVLTVGFVAGMIMSENFPSFFAQSDNSDTTIDHGETDSSEAEIEDNSTPAAEIPSSEPEESVEESTEADETISTETEETEETVETVEKTTESPEPTSPETEEVEDVLLYFILNCDVQYFSKEDLAGFDAEMCRIARNGIYARLGRKFQDKALAAYFEQYEWYEPTIEADDFSDSMLNQYQIANRDLILAYEEEQGYR